MAAELRNDVLCVKGESRECFELRGEEVFDEPKVEFFGGTAADNLEEALVEMAGGQRKHVDSTNNKRRRKGYSSSSSSLLSLLLSFVAFLL